MLKKKLKVKQRDITDCGAACISSVSNYYNLSLPLAAIRQYAGTDRKGTNVLGLIEAAEHLGFQAKGAKGELESLTKIPLPAIAHLQLKNGLLHYVVIYSVSKETVTIMDPADGIAYKKSFEEFKETWTGVLVLLIPGENFEAGNKKTSNIKRFWQLILPHKSIMFQALTGAVVYTVLGLSSSIYMQKIVDHVLVEGNLKLLNLLGVIMIFILVFQVFIGAFKAYLSFRTGQYIDVRLILGYYKHLLKLPQRFFDTMRVGEIISRVNDAVKIRLFINEVALNLVVNTLIIFFSVALMFFYYWKLAVIILALIPLYMLIYFISNKINKKWQRKIMERSADLESQLVESLNAVGTIKKFGIEDYTNIKTESKFIRLLKTGYQTGIYGLYLTNVADFFTRLFTIIILWAGSYYVINNELSPGELLSFYALIGHFTSPAASLIGANKSIQDAMIASDRLFEIIDLETENTDTNKVILTSDLIGDITFKNVTFRYGTRQLVFDNLNLCIEKGKSTAIVGESGSGKSTLMALLQNLYPVVSGNINIGSFSIEHISNTSLRNVVAVVPQQIDLFGGTIIENIALGDLNPNMERLLKISQLLGINEFIESMPNTYNTVLYDQGVNLSSGQRQRIAIARAIYKNPEILILDEATSNLDPGSETNVQSALQWFKNQNKTIIIIAHRLSTIRSCDKIIVLQKGALIEEGTHSELMEIKGSYFNLWQFHTALP